jgi:hypothetical protein
MASKGLSLSPSMLLTRTTSCAVCLPPETAWRLLLPRPGAFSCHGALHPRHRPQASPCFLKRRVRRRLSPPRVAFSARPRSFLSLICQVCAQCSASFCRILDSVILLSLLLFCFPSHFPCPCSCCSPCNPVYFKRMRFCTRTGPSS